MRNGRSSSCRSTSNGAARFRGPSAERLDARRTTPSSGGWWRHLNFFEYETHLVARMARVRCGKCGMRPVAAPWARPGSGFTPVRGADSDVGRAHAGRGARLVGEHHTRIWRVLHHYVDQARHARDDRQVSRVGIDETASRRRYHYVSRTGRRRCRSFVKISKRTEATPNAWQRSAATCRRRSSVAWRQPFRRQRLPLTSSTFCNCSQTRWTRPVRPRGRSIRSSKAGVTHCCAIQRR